MKNKCSCCGGRSWTKNGPVVHTNSCTGYAVSDEELKSFAGLVKSTGFTLGRDQEVVDAVRVGLLTVGDAMNTDD